MLFIFLFLLNSFVLSDPGEFYLQLLSGEPSSVSEEPSSSTPGGKGASCAFTDPANNFYVFGGMTGIGAFNSIFKLNKSSGEWSHVQGTLFTDDTGNYVDQGSFNSTSIPYSRSYAACTQNANKTRLYVYGGTVIASNLGDAWELDTTTLEWKWLFGSNSLSSGGSVSTTPGVYNAADRPDFSWGGSLIFSEANNSLFLFFGSSSVDTSSQVSAIWQYSLDLGQWRLYHGALASNDPGSYTQFQIWSGVDYPGARYGHAQTLIDIDIVAIYGGNLGANARDDVWFYNITSNQFRWSYGTSATTFVLAVPNEFKISGNSSTTAGSRAGHTIFPTDNSSLEFYSISGSSQNSNSDSVVWWYSNDSWTWYGGSLGVYPYAPNSLKFKFSNLTRTGQRGFTHNLVIDSNNIVWMYGGIIDLGFSILRNDVWLISHTSSDCNYRGFLFSGPGPNNISDGCICGNSAVLNISDFNSYSNSTQCIPSPNNTVSTQPGYFIPECLPSYYRYDTWEPSEKCLTCPSFATCSGGVDNLKCSEPTRMLKITNNLASCVPCPDNSLCYQTKILCDQDFYLQNNMCLECPRGAECPGGSSPYNVAFGFFLDSDSNFFECSPEAICLGKNKCFSYRTGLGCAKCEPHYAKGAHSCVSCSGGLVTILILLCIFLALLFFFASFHHHESITKHVLWNFWIVFDCWHLFATLAFVNFYSKDVVAPLWSELTESAGVSFISLAVFDPPGCSRPDITFFGHLSLNMSFPFIFALISNCFIAFFLYFNTRYLHWRRGSSLKKRKSSSSADEAEHDSLALREMPPDDDINSLAPGSPRSSTTSVTDKSAASSSESPPESTSSKANASTQTNNPQSNSKNSESLELPTKPLGFFSRASSSIPKLAKISLNDSPRATAKMVRQFLSPPARAPKLHIHFRFSFLLFHFYSTWMILNALSVFQCQEINGEVVHRYNTDSKCSGAEYGFAIFWSLLCIFTVVGIHLLPWVSPYPVKDSLQYWISYFDSPSKYDPGIFYYISLRKSFIMPLFCLFITTTVSGTCLLYFFISALHLWLVYNSPENPLFQNALYLATVSFIISFIAIGFISHPISWASYSIGLIILPLLWSGFQIFRFIRIQREFRSGSLSSENNETNSDVVIDTNVVTDPNV